MSERDAAGQEENRTRVQDKSDHKNRQCHFRRAEGGGHILTLIIIFFISYYYNIVNILIIF